MPDTSQTVLEPGVDDADVCGHPAEEGNRVRVRRGPFPRLPCPRASYDRPVSALEIVALLLPWMVVAFLAWLLVGVVRQHGHALVRIDQLRERLDAMDRTIERLAPAHAPLTAPGLSGLTVGATAPSFALPDLDGRERTLEEFHAEPFVVAFFDSGCGYCQAMAPRLGGVSATSTRMLIVARGDADWYCAAAAEHEWSCAVVLDADGQVAAAYQTTATPTGYLIGVDGRIAAPLAIGADALLELTGSDAERLAVERARAAGLSVRETSTSRIKRDGLDAGTPAPNFELPDLNGQQHTLSDFRGQRVLLDVYGGAPGAFAPASASGRDETVSMRNWSRGTR
jgi:peroxiredoxin